jgi:hypothetical protein
MVFVTINFASTAQLEGIARGIPVMIARDSEINDYVSLESSVVPIGPVEQIVAEIARCADPAYYERLTEQQMAWLRRETSF